MHLKRLIAIKVLLLQSRLESCNCSIKLCKRHITNLHTKNGVRSTAQISGLFGQQEHSDVVNRIWLHEGRNITKVLVTRAVLLSYKSGKTQKQLCLLRLFESAKQTKVYLNILFADTRRRHRN